MQFRGSTLDDVLGNVLGRLIKRGSPILPNRGRAKEFTGVSVRLTDPQARFSRTEGRGTLFSSLGETLWYLAASNRLDFITYYISNYRDFIKAPESAVEAPGGYGPRLFGGGTDSQIASLIHTLKNRGGVLDTRQAVVQIFDRSDLRPGNGDVPCTTTLQFLPRKNKLHLIATMRSNDAWRGFSGDVFAFTFIQELVAKSLGLKLGEYCHFVGSLHLYDDDLPAAHKYIREGVQTPMGMPDMPDGDPWSSVAWLLSMEEALRVGGPEPSSDGIDAYWLDLMRLLRIKALFNKGDFRSLVKEKIEMTSSVYNSFIRGRQAVAARKLEAQMILPGIPYTDNGGRTS